jgi:hypothetical protein
MRYDPNQLIKNLFQQIQDARAFAGASGQPYRDVIIVDVDLNLVSSTGLFLDACRVWQARAISDKTWMQFKIDFTAAHRKFHLTNQSAQQSGFHSANMMIEQGTEKPCKVMIFIDKDIITKGDKSAFNHVLVN